jgi:hypothetical protein
MSIILATPDGRELKVNAWSWGALHSIVSSAGVFPSEVWEPKRSDGGGILEARQVAILADFLSARVLPRLGDGERMFGDGSVTDIPDSGALYRGGDDPRRNYSLHHDVLVEVIEFLRSAAGPISIH